MTNPRVAIVDDDEHVRRGLRRMVASLSYETAEFASGAAFLSALADHRFTCVMLDLHMPELNGLDVLMQMRAGGQKVPVILITGGDEPRLRQRCMNAGASAYLVKPLPRDVVVQTIHALAGRPDHNTFPA